MVLVGYYCSIIAYIRFLSEYRTCISFQNRKSAFIWVNHWAYAYKTMTTRLSWNDIIKYFKAWHFTTNLKTHFWKYLIKFLYMPYIDYSLLCWKICDNHHHLQYLFAHPVLQNMLPFCANFYYTLNLSHKFSAKYQTLWWVPLCHYPAVKSYFPRGKLTFTAPSGVRLNFLWHLMR